MSTAHGPSAHSNVPANGAAPGEFTGYLIKLTVISTLGGLLFGYDTGVISGALPFLKADLNLSDVQEASVVSALLFGAMIGALIGGKLSDVLGRKGALRFCAILFFFGALGSALAPSFGVMVPARIVLGIAVGAAAATVPVYLAEMAPAHRRGRMVTINELMIVSGQLLAFAINALINALFGGQSVWRWMLIVAAIPAIALFIGLFFLPESPRWYAVRSRLDDAKRVLGLSRPPQEAAEEYNVIATHAQRDVSEDKGAALRDLRAYAWMRRLLWIGIGLAIVQQATGINTVNYYAPTILESAGVGTSAALVLTITVGVVGVGGTILGIYLLGHVNRRPLVMIGLHWSGGGPPDSRPDVPAAGVPDSGLPDSRRDAGGGVLCPDLYWHIDLAAALGNLPDDNPWLRDGHRRVHSLDHEHDHLLRLPAAGGGAGCDADLRLVHARQCDLAPVCLEVLPRNPWPHPGGTGGRLPRARRCAPRPHPTCRRVRLLIRRSLNWAPPGHGVGLTVCLTN